MRGRLLVSAVAAAALVAWPLAGLRNASASRAYDAPVTPDYLYRDRTVAFYEARVHADPRDQISARMLAGQYMQRYREGQDVGDILRAIDQARRSLALQPQNNAAADELAGSGYYALHDFRRAFAYYAAAHQDEPADPNAPAQMALLEMEMGRYREALADIRAARLARDGPGIWAAQSRYDELTGELPQALVLMQRAAQSADRVVNEPAQARAWYHFRIGEMLFASGRVDQAEQQERLAIAQFPQFEMAYRALARFCWGARDWQCALRAAKSAAGVIPEPESLGYEADAQAALGDAAGAAQTRELIRAVERIGNAYHINDRLLAVYYSEHGIRLDDALAIAQREARNRGNEIFAQDTLAWAAAMDGRWKQAYPAMLLAMRYNTQDPRILFHAGTIEAHFGHRARAKLLLSQALALNPQWDPIYAPAARTELAALSVLGALGN